MIQLPLNSYVWKVLNMGLLTVRTILIIKEKYIHSKLDIIKKKIWKRETKAAFAEYLIPLFFLQWMYF